MIDWKSRFGGHDRVQVQRSYVEGSFGAHLVRDRIEWMAGVVDYREGPMRPRERDSHNE